MNTIIQNVCLRALLKDILHKQIVARDYFYSLSKTLRYNTEINNI